MKKKNIIWSFDIKKKNFFDNHIKKSIPLYNEFHNIFLSLSSHFIKKNTRVIDLGCSSGIFLKKIYDLNKHNKIFFEGYDVEKNLIYYCKKTFSSTKIKFLCKDFTKINFKKTSLVTSFFSIQFIEQHSRLNLLKKINKQLIPGGAFFFIEKVLGKNSEIQEKYTQLYTDFKLDNFSPLQILKKTKSLSGVMKPNTSTQNIKLLKNAGFNKIHLMIKYGPFEGWLAEK